MTSIEEKIARECEAIDQAMGNPREVRVPERRDLDMRITLAAKVRLEKKIENLENEIVVLKTRNEELLKEVKGLKNRARVDEIKEKRPLGKNEWTDLIAKLGEQ